MATIVLGAVGAAVGGSLGGGVLGLSSVVIGRAVGSTLGRIIDQKLLGGGSEVVETGRLDRLRILGASEGGAVPNVYGRMRVSGNVIWTSRFRENVTVTEQSGGKGGPKPPKTKSYSYSVNVALALCEGEISRIGRIWADGQIISKSDLTMRVYNGTASQLPDPIISAVEGAENTPAYRGVAYVVFENLELADYGNRVPQLSFEVIRAAKPKTIDDVASVQELVTGVAMMPGTGEYALATTPVYRDGGAGTVAANINTAEGVPDFVASLDALNSELPNCRAASLIVSWFGDDLRAGECRVLPKVEFGGQGKDAGVGSSPVESGSENGAWGSGNGSARFPWRVCGIEREDAQAVAQVEGRPIYGGTPSDASVVEAIEALAEAGKDVMFYPFLLMEVLEGNDKPDPWSDAAHQAALPWRGRITTQKAPGIAGSTDATAAATQEVAAFMGTARPSDFTISGKTVIYTGPNETSYRRFILHYAHLCKAAGGVDSFCIGSEMRALTQIRNDAGSFPAVEALRVLAGDVRLILGAGTKIGYAADWSEYFGYHPQDGSGDVRFHLDPLWADDAIDFIGIDNYMPIADWRDGDDHADADAGSIYSISYLQGNIEGGEGYDWYYRSTEDRAAQIRTPIIDGAHGEDWVYRYKDIRSWWSQPHHDRIAGERSVTPTAWRPKSKPIWFTEIGSAAIDKGPNQPNKFLDPKSSESSVPHFSSGYRDDYVQMQYLRAYFSYFDDAAHNPVSGLYGGNMVDMSHSFVWAWDARPWPDFPNNTALWSDGPNHLTGHWLNGRTGIQPLSHVVGAICEAGGLTNYDISNLHGIVRGYAISDVETPRASLQPLMVGFGFDAIERQGKLIFQNRDTAIRRDVDPAQFVLPDDEETSNEHLRAPEAEVVGQVRLGYVEAEGEFVARIAEARFPDDIAPVATQNDLPLALTPAEARSMSERWLSEARIARDTVRLTLPPSRLDVGAGDIIDMKDTSGTNTLWRVDRVENRSGREIEAVRMERQIYKPSHAVDDMSDIRPFAVAVPIAAQFMDLPLLTGNESPYAPYIAASANPWMGGAAVYGAPQDSDYKLKNLIENPSILGVTEGELRRVKSGVWDRGAALRVRVSRAGINAVSREAVLNGANACAIGDGSTGRWEVFQFANAQLVGPLTYELSDRLRGQAGTDAMIPDVWPTGSRIVLLNGAPTQIDTELSARGLERHYRVGPVSKPYDDPSCLHYIQSFDGIGMRPYAPAHLKIRHHAGDIVATWVRRTRIDGDSWVSVDVPLGEDGEHYIVRIMREGVVIRETFVDEPTWTYTSALRIADSVENSFDISIAQISQTFGPGLFTGKTIHD